MAETQFVTLRHAETGGVADFPPDAVPLWEAKGWRPLTASEQQAEATDPPMFDPGTHSVAQVEAYLAAADETERERVLASERAGKNRATLVGE